MDVGFAGDAQRQRWWDEVISPAYGIQHIPEIRSPPNPSEDDPSWRNRLGGGGADELSREEQWMNLGRGLGLLHADRLILRLGLQIQLVGDTYDNILLSYPRAPVITLARANMSIAQLTDLEERLIEEAPEEFVARAPEVPKIPVAPPCMPIEPEFPEEDSCAADPSYTVPDWTAERLPFLNSRDCEYYIPVTTAYPCPGAAELPARVAEHIPQAIIQLMDFLSKDYDPEATSGISETVSRAITDYVIDQGAHEFDKSPNRNLKLLYKIPFYMIKALRIPDRGLSSTADSNVPGPTIELDSASLFQNLDALKVALGRFKQEQALQWKTDKVKVVKAGSSLEINIGEKGALLKTLKTDLSALLKANKYKMAEGVDDKTKASNLPGYEVKGNEFVAEQLAIACSGDFQLQGVSVRERGSEFVELNITPLSKTSPLRDPTIVSYLANLESILVDLNRTEPVGVLEFAERYQFPRAEPSYASTENNIATTGDTSGCGEITPENIGELIGNSVLDLLVEASDMFASKFAEYGCMDAQEIKERNKLIAQSSQEMEEILDGEMFKQLFTGDPLLKNIGDTISGAMSQGNAVIVAWQELFDKMTMCGLLSLILKTLKSIASADVCGMSIEDVLTKMIGSALAQVDTSDMQRVFDSLPPQLQGQIREAYGERIGPIVTSSGFTGGLTFPWEYEEVEATAQSNAESGILLYRPPVFDPPSHADILIQSTNSYALGQAQDFAALSQGSGNEAFWAGYLQEYDPANVHVPTLADVQTEITSFASNTLDFASSLIQAFVESIIELVSVDQLIELTKDIPVIGGLIQALVNVGKCVINKNLENASTDPMAMISQALDFSSLQNNLTGGDKDLCEMITSALPSAPGKRKPGPKRPIVLPDIEQIMLALKTQTSWSAIQNTIISVLKEKLIQILVTVLTKLISKAAEALTDAMCSLVNGSAPEALGLGGTDPLSDENILGGSSSDPAEAMKALFSAAFCSDGLMSMDVDSLVGGLMSSLAGLAPDEALALTGPESVDNMMSAVSSRVSMEQMLELLQGQASPSTLDTVVDILQERSVPMAALLSSPSAVMDFFGSMGSAFPQGFLNQAGRNLRAAGGSREIISNICEPDPLSDLADALREECGDAITEEQVQQQVANFENRMQDLVGDLSKSFGSGLNNSMTDTIQKTLAESLPKDEPGNLTIADDVISAMFDPFYLQYAQELMKPIDPFSGNAGFLNLVLSNKAGVPQRGQIGLFNMLSSFPIFPLPPPLDVLASEGIADAMRNDFFGPDEDHPLRAKPTTIGKQLQYLLLAGLSPQFVGDKVTLGYSTPSGVYTLDYDFSTGKLNSWHFVIPPMPIPPPPPIPGIPMIPPAFPNPLVNPSKSLSFTFSENALLLDELEDLLYLPSAGGPSLETSFAAAGGDLDTFTEPLNVGTAVLVKNFIANGFVLTDTNALEDFSEMVQFMRRTALQSMANAVAKPAGEDNPAFVYGEYNLERLTPEDIYPAPTEEILDKGYKVAMLDDGSGRIRIQPPLKGGWLEIKDILLPPDQDEFCCPRRKELFDVEALKTQARETYKLIDDDPRLALNPKTVQEPPYSKILARMNLAIASGLVETTLRVYIIEYFLKSMAPFRVFKTDVPSTFGTLMAEYVVQNIRKGMMKQQPFPGAPLAVPPEFPPNDKLHGYWYEFLEQSVQTYARRVMAKELVPSRDADDALQALQTYIESYKMPTKKDLLEERIAASILLGPIAFIAVTMKGLRRRKKLKALRETEAAALVVLRDLVANEFARMSNNIDQIFSPPPGGWSSDVYQEFLNNAYSVDGSNIFDIPSTYSPAAADAHSRNPLLNGLARADFGDRSQFVLESYVRCVKNAAGEERWGSDIPDGIYGIDELQQRFLAAEGLSTTAALAPTADELGSFIFLPSTYFSTFNVGLRLVYVPIRDDLPGGPDSVRDAMTAAPFDNATRLFKQVSLPDDIGWGRFSIPMVFSPTAEAHYSHNMVNFIASVHMVGANTRQVSIDTTTINWQALSQQLISTPEFQAMFGYAVQLRTINALVSIYCSEAFLPLIGMADMWTVPPLDPPEGLPLPPGPVSYRTWNRKSFMAMKRRLKRAFLDVYNSNDFTYRSEPLGKREREEVAKLGKNTSIESWEDGLGADFKDRVVIESALSLCPDIEEEE